MIKVLVHYTKSWKDLADITVCNMMEYCERHGYELVNWEVADYSKYTGIHKLTQIQKTLEYGDIALVIDADAMITNHEIKIEDFVDDEHDFFICKDINSINSGVFLIRLTKWSEGFVKYLINEVANGWVDCEQNAIELYLKEFPNTNKIKILPHPSINSYPIDYYYPSYGKIGYVDGEIVTKPTHKKGAWKEGDFICHCPALPLKQRIEIFKNINIIK